MTAFPLTILAILALAAAAIALRRRTRNKEPVFGEPPVKPIKTEPLIAKDSADCDDDLPF